MTDRLVITGADGCLGTALVRRLRGTGTRITAYLHAADAADLADRADRLAAVAGEPVDCRPLELGDGFDLDDLAGADLVHAAGITHFKVSAERAAAINVEGTRRVLSAAAEAGTRRAIVLGSLYASGLRPGLVPEGPLAEPPGFANHYEHSKWQVERVAAAAALPVTVLRPGTVLVDDRSGRVGFANAVHHTLALGYQGLLSVLPARADTPLFLVTADGTADAILAALRGEHRDWANVSPDAAAALDVGTLLEVAWRTWTDASADFRRRRPAPPLFCDLDTFTTFAGEIASIVEPRVGGALRGLAPFAPQLLLHKDIENTVGTALAPDAGAGEAELTALCRQVLTAGFPARKPRRA